MNNIISLHKGGLGTYTTEYFDLHFYPIPSDSVILPCHHYPLLPVYYPYPTTASSDLSPAAASPQCIAYISASLQYSHWWWPVVVLRTSSWTIAPPTPRPPSQVANTTTPYLKHRDLFPVTLWVTWLLDCSITLIINSMITQLFLPWIRTDIALARIVAPTFNSTPGKIPQQLSSFLRSWWRKAQFMLLNSMVQNRYGKADTTSNGSISTFMVTWLTLKQRCRVFYLWQLYLPMQLWYMLYCRLCSCHRGPVVHSACSADMVKDVPRVFGWYPASAFGWGGYGFCFWSETIQGSLGRGTDI